MLKDAPSVAGDKAEVANLDDAADSRPVDVLKRGGSVPLAPRGPWSIKTLHNVADMRKHAREWLDLERYSIDPHAAFQSFVWCESWAATYCERSPDLPQPRIFMIYRGDMLMAILPMMVSRHMGAQMLTLFAEPHSQIANAIVRAGYDCRDGLRLCVEQAAMLTDSDLVAIGPLPQDSELAQALDQTNISPDPAEEMCLVKWEGATREEDYVRQLSKNRRKDHNQKLNRVSELGAVYIEAYQIEDPEFKPYVKEALANKQLWLEENGIASIGLSREGVDEFLTRFVQHEGGFLPEVEVLFVGQKALAININIVGRNVRHCYLSSYDLAYKDYSPGAILHQMSIRSSVENGMIALNFLGYPTYFKRLWSTDFVPLVRYQKAITLRGRLWLDLWTAILRPALKRAFLYARELTRLPVVGPVMGEVLSRLAPSKT